MEDKKSRLSLLERQPNSVMFSVQRITLQKKTLSSISPSYIMPPIPGCGVGIAADCGSGLSVIRHSVVKKRPAIDAAFSSATRATLAGSMMPALRKSSYLSARAL